MNDIFAQILSYASGVWRRRWYMLAVAWLVCGAGWTAVASLPDRYQSSARIYVDMDTMLGPLMKGIAVEMNLYQQIDIMRRTLLSRPNLEKVILMTDLDLTVRTDEEKERLIDMLANRINVVQQGRNLFQISYEATERDLTRRIVQSVMQIFVESNLGASRKDMETTRRFLEAQIRSYERQLIEAESRLAKFKRENMGFLPGDGNYYSHMQDMRRKLAQTESQIGEAVMIRDELRTQLGEVPQYLEVTQEGTGPTGSSSGPASDLQIRILEMQQVIDSLLTRYTEQHPDVQSAQRRLAALKRQLEAELAAAAMAGPGSDTPATGPGKATVPNPLYERIKLQLVQQEGVIAALRSRSEQARQDVEKWAGMAQLVPQVEAQLAQLDRDYEIVKRGYEQLRQRQESARLAGEMETKAQKVQFRIIDPPKLPVSPSGPNRPTLFMAVLMAGIGAGIGFAFLLSQVNTTFPSVPRLRSAFTLPVLGRISAIVSPRERRQRIRELAGFSIVGMFLVFACFTLIGIEIIGAGNVLGKIKDLGII